MRAGAAACARCPGPLSWNTTYEKCFSFAAAMSPPDRNGQPKNWPAERGAFQQPAEDDSREVSMCAVATGVLLNLAHHRLAHANRLNTAICADSAKIDEQHTAERMWS
jgi:hypothetical protein